MNTTLRINSGDVGGMGQNWKYDVIFFKVTHSPYEKAGFHGRRITDILSIAICQSEDEMISVPIKLTDIKIDSRNCNFRCFDPRSGWEK